MKARVLLSLVILFAAAVIPPAGCVAPLDQAKARAARRDLPGRFPGARPSAQAAPGTKGADPAPPPVSVAAQQQWDELFSDPALQALIEEALRNNQELNIRVQEIIIARNELAARRGEYMPKVGAEAGLGLEKVGKYTSQGAADEANGLPVHLPDVHAGMTATWEIDLWGKLRNAARSARHRLAATAEAQHFLVTELVAEIASSYYELAALDAQLEVLSRNLTIQADALEAVRLKKQAGRATELELQRFKAEILKNKAHLFELEQERVLVENHINVLVGRYPQPVARDPQALARWAPDTVQTGVPAALLDNRPDVREAAEALEAAKLDVEVAKARFYPSLSIDLKMGYEAFNPLYLLATPASFMYDAAGSVVMPLLNRAAITADYRSANAMQIQAVLHFERTLLRAFTDVANQLVKIDKLRQRYDQQSQQVQTLVDAVEVSSLLYRSARADYMEVLLTRRDAVEAEMDLIETRREQMKSLVGVYQALGGGWRPRPPRKVALAAPAREPVASLAP